MQKRKQFQLAYASIFLIILALLLTGCPGKEQKIIKKIALKKEPMITVYNHLENKVQKMKLEEYIAGVVAGEIKNDKPLNALAAQAILARTFTLEAINRKGTIPGRNAQASTNPEEFQAYNAQNINAKIRKAVQMTRGKVVTYNGNYIHAWFFSSSGGSTAKAKEGLEFNEAEPPYTKIVKSPPTAKDDIDPWIQTFTLAEVQAALTKMGTKAGTITNMKIAKKGPSGRTTRIKITHSGGSEIVSAPALRIALGSDKMRSTLLKNLEVKGGNITMSGTGWGHGVGMSQNGAIALAQAKKSPDQIIRYYFSGIQIQQAWK